MTLVHKPSLIVRIAIAAVLLFTSAPVAFTQAPSPMQIPDKADPSVKIPQFEIISVKPSEDHKTRVQFTPDGMHGIQVTIQFLLFEGFGGINQNQVVGMPSWAGSDGFDIEAKVAPTDVATLAKLTFDQRRTMFQQILTERFKLVTHHETREIPIYQLTVGKGGSKLKASAPDTAAAPAPSRKGLMFSNGKMTANDSPLSMFVTVLARQLGRPVVDKTGLAGNYDFAMEWAPSGDASTDPDGPSIFTAIQEQLGLKLESTKGPIDVVVIDHIEKPVAN